MKTEVDERQNHLGRLKIAEQQFRLACTVNLAITNGIQTLDVPVEWGFGRHRVSYEDFGLRPDQADLAASQLEMTATFVMAAAIRDVLVAFFPDPKRHENPSIVASYQISRTIRNAFSHSMLCPKWSIDDDCKDRTFIIDDVITLHTAGLHDKSVRWQDYGGPLAIFYFGRFVREELLGDKVDPARKKPAFPTVQCYQQGRLVLRRVDEMSANLTLVAADASPGESP